jgi:hypothetical protein
MRASLKIASAFAIALAAGVRADTPAAPQSAPPAGGENGVNVIEMMAQMGGVVAAGADKPDQPYPEFKDVTKDMVSKEGMFTLWSYPADAKDKDTEKLLAQIPSALLGQKIMLSTSVAGGGYFTGFPSTSAWSRCRSSISNCSSCSPKRTTSPIRATCRTPSSARIPTASVSRFPSSRSPRAAIR